MKQISFFLVIGILVFSCSDSNEEFDFGTKTYYELSYVNAGMSGQIVDKEDLDFSESIEFFADNTFVKKRVYADSSSVASGSYSAASSEGFDYLKLEYDIDTYLIQNCTNSSEEYLRIISETELFNGGYLPCDGPGYFYTKSNK